MGDIRISIKGMAEVQHALENFPRQLAQYLARAGWEAGSEILNTKGLRAYPPDKPRAPQSQYWSDNQRRHFFWLLRTGQIEVPYRRGLSRRSETYGKQFYIDRDVNNWITRIGNRASYAKYLGGLEQSKYMENRGWLQLRFAAGQKFFRIQKIYEAWINRLIIDMHIGKK